jgi:cytosine/adenosine deaminase-related metal-dependent hydrolase
MLVHRAAWVLPVAAPPIRDGWVAVEGGLIVALGGDRAGIPSGAVEAEASFDASAILPGLVNAHTHLEVSWMAGQVGPAPSMPEWVARLMSLRASVSQEPREPISHAVSTLRACGTTLVGEVTNTLASCDALLDSALSAYVFHEVLGFNAEDPRRVAADALARLATLPAASRLRSSVVPHAPYSVSAELLRTVADVSAGRVVSVHVGESPEEIQFLLRGTGAWRALLDAVGAWNPRWSPPGCGPVAYLDRCGLVSSRLLAVHCVHVSGAELSRLAAGGATVVTCPRSNRWTGAGTPPVRDFYASGVRVAIGTDSLASVEDLNLFNEMKALRGMAPDLPARRILESATKHGADALGFGMDLGTLESGKRAELIAVRIPPRIEDVEEYLLSGVQPADVVWLDPDCGEP